MKAFIESQFSYCPLIWMFHNRTMNNRINAIHERSLRIVYRDHDSTFEQLLMKDESYNIHERNLQRLATEIYKVKNNLTPEFMKDIFTDMKHPYNLRKKPEFKTWNVQTVYCGTETLSFRGPKVWSIVPDDIKASNSLIEFKKKIKKWKPQGCICRLCKIYLPQIGFI